MMQYFIRLAARDIPLKMPPHFPTLLARLAYPHFPQGLKGPYNVEGFKLHEH